MKVTLIGYSNPMDNSDDPKRIVYTSLAQCYNSSFNPNEDLYPCEDKIEKITNQVIKSGHHSVAEHVSFTFLIEDVSRALTHQLVRHRIASFSQKSQRYTNSQFFVYVIPPSITKNKEALELYMSTMDNLGKVYGRLYNEFEIPKEDARFVLPNACTTNIAMTMNIRSLGNFFGKRLCTRAQWEIRNLAKELSNICKSVCPLFFEKNKLGYADCIQNGYCKEEKSCGLMPKLADLQNAYDSVKNSKNEEKIND